LPDHSELGYTFTRDDGWFDLAVNGGGSARLRYRRPGALPAQRIVPVPLEQIVHVPDVILVPLDEDVQVVSAGASTMQTVADTVTGTRGTRRHSALFAAGTHPQAVLEDGSKIPLAQLSVRITEYTVGENGPKRMPAPLPPTSQYTLAFEVSVDEAIQLRAESVELDKPVV